MKSISKEISDRRKLSQENKNGFNKILILHVSNTEYIRNEIYPVVIRFQGLLTVWPMIFYHNIIFQPAHKSTRSDNLFCWNKLLKYANQDDKIVYSTWVLSSLRWSKRHAVHFCLFLRFDLTFLEEVSWKKGTMKNFLPWKSNLPKKGFIFLESIVQQHE